MSRVSRSVRRSRAPGSERPGEKDGRRGAVLPGPHRIGSCRRSVSGSFSSRAASPDARGSRGFARGGPRRSWGGVKAPTEGVKALGESWSVDSCRTSRSRETSSFGAAGSAERAARRVNQGPRRGRRRLQRGASPGEDRPRVRGDPGSCERTRRGIKASKQRKPDRAATQAVRAQGDREASNELVSADAGEGGAERGPIVGGGQRQGSGCSWVGVAENRR